MAERDLGVLQRCIRDHIEAALRDAHMDRGEYYNLRKMADDRADDITRWVADVIEDETAELRTAVARAEKAPHHVCEGCGGAVAWYVDDTGQTRQWRHVDQADSYAVGAHRPVVVALAADVPAAPANPAVASRQLAHPEHPLDPPADDPYWCDAVGHMTPLEPIADRWSQCRRCGEKFLSDRPKPAPAAVVDPADGDKEAP